MRNIVAGTWLIVIIGSSALIYLNWTRYPLGNARDERDHLRLIEFYATEGRFPVLPQDFITPQAHQPPLYYLLTALIVKTALPPLESMAHYEDNPFMIAQNYNPALPYYNRVLYVHHWAGSDAGYIFSFRLLRAVSLLMQAAGLVFLARGLGHVFPHPSSRILPPLAVGLLSLTPAFWRRGLGVSNNALLFLLAMIAFYVMATALSQGWTIRRSLGLGVTLGLGMLTKLYMAPLFLTAALVAPWRAKPRETFLIFLVAGLIGGGWYLRNYALYGDFTAVSVSETEQVSRRDSPPTTGEWLEILTRWPGQLGVESWVMLNTRTDLHLASAIGLALFLSGTLAALSGRIKNRAISGTGRLLLAIFLPAGMMALWGASRNLHALFSPPLLLVGLPGLAGLCAIGLLAWWPVRWWGRIALTGILGLVIGTTLFTAVIFEPQYPAFTSLESPDESLTPVDVRFQNGAQLVGYTLQDRVLHPGDTTRIKLCWSSEGPLDRSYAFTVQLIWENLPKAALQDGYPLSGRYPTTAWRQPFCEWIPLTIHQDTLTPRAYQLRVGMYEYGGSDVFYLLPDGRPDELLLLERIPVISPVPDTLPDLQLRVDSWGGLSHVEANIDNGQFTLQLSWVTLEAASGRYHYFLHAVDSDGRPLNQFDGPPLGGAFPTHRWVYGITFEDVLTLALPPDTVEIFFGMYDTETFQRGIWRQGDESLGDSLHFSAES